MALCSQADIEALRTADITAEPDSTITALISHAEGILEGLTGRTFAPVANVEAATSSLSQADGTIWLAVYPLTAVAVANSDGDPYDLDVHYSWTVDGRIRRLGAGVSTWSWQYEPWRTPEWPIGTVITYSGGITDPDEAPRDLRGVCAELAADLWGRATPSGPGGVTDESLGGYSVTYQTMAGNLTDQQQKIIRKYRRDRGSLVLY